MRCLTSTPPGAENPPSPPPEYVTRWQGITSGMSFLPRAVATARAASGWSDHLSQPAVACALSVVQSPAGPQHLAAERRLARQLAGDLVELDGLPVEVRPAQLDDPLEGRRVLDASRGVPTPAVGPDRRPGSAAAPAGAGAVLGRHRPDRPPRRGPDRVKSRLIFLLCHGKDHSPARARQSSAHRKPGMHGDRPIQTAKPPRSYVPLAFTPSRCRRLRRRRAGRCPRRSWRGPCPARSTRSCGRGVRVGRRIRRSCSANC